MSNIVFKMPEPLQGGESPKFDEKLLAEVAGLITRHLDAYDQHSADDELMAELEGLVNTSELGRIVAARVLNLLFHRGALAPLGKP